MADDNTLDPAMEGDVLVTKEGLQKLKDELQNLKEVRLKEVAERLKEAISYGDLSENSEYEDAKNEQAFVVGRMAELEEQIKNAKIIGHHAGAVVQIGSTVVLKNLKTRKDETYTVVGSTETDPNSNKISNESPVGKAILGLSTGEKVVVEVPEGSAEYKIESLS